MKIGSMEGEKEVSETRCFKCGGEMVEGTTPIFGDSFAYHAQGEIRKSWKNKAWTEFELTIVETAVTSSSIKRSRKTKSRFVEFSWTP